MSLQELLLQAETSSVVDPNISSFSPLHCALVRGNEQCGQLLLSHSASLDTPDTEGNTPLLLAYIKVTSTHFGVE